jgi:hypothetical protein
VPREPLTLLHESGLEGVDGRPNLLLAGTAHKLFRYSIDGSWILLHCSDFCDDGDWIGGRFLVAQLAGLCLVGHTRGGFWDLTFDATATATEFGGRYSYLTPNDSLIALGIEAANVVLQSNGYFFLFDLTIDGRRERGLGHWSDFESTNYIPGGDSEAGYISFGGDKVLAAEELGGSIIVYTDRSIWSGSYVGGEVVWNFTRIYVGPDVPAYPRAVVNLGDAHMYVTENSIRMLFRGERTPRVFDWLDKASGAIFQGIKASLLEGMPVGSVDYPRKARGGCLHLVGFYNSKDQIVGFSWADTTSQVPNWTLLLSVANRTGCLVDHGITAATNTRQPLAGTAESFRSFLRRTMGCIPKPDVNEHDPFPVDYPAVESEPAHLFNATEDPALPPSVDSWCSLIEASDTPCLTHCNPCPGPLRFIFASAEDYGVKEFRWDFDRREQIETVAASPEWNNLPTEEDPSVVEGPNPVAEAEYRFDNYLTLFQSDCFIGGKGQDVVLGSIEIAGVATEKGEDLTEELVPSTVLPWPVAGQGAGAMAPGCASWNVRDVDAFTCGVEQDLPTYVHKADNPEVHLECEGRYIAYRIYVGGETNIGPMAFIGLTIHGGSANC